MEGMDQRGLPNLSGGKSRTSHCSHPLSTVVRCPLPSFSLFYPTLKTERWNLSPRSPLNPTEDSPPASLPAPFLSPNISTPRLQPPICTPNSGTRTSTRTMMKSALPMSLRGSGTASSIPGLGHRRRPSWLPLPGCPLSIRPPSSSFKRTARFRDMELTARSYLAMLCTSAPDPPASSNWPGRVVPAQQIPPAPAPTRSEAALRRKVSPPKGRIRLCPPLCTRPLLPQP